MARALTQQGGERFGPADTVRDGALDGGEQVEPLLFSVGADAGLLDPFDVGL